MTLQPGMQLGPYEIASQIGAGGMGEVYRARDTRLDRTVAIKVLPLHLSDQPERRERFEREARAVSALNHPHICVVHDIGKQDDIDFFVMEFVDGENLANRLARGPLPLKDALRYGAQIADALDKAHRSGITHRDLKPGNVMITKAGAKLLDFGLAKLSGLENRPMTVSVSALPTDVHPLTSQGTIVGTLQYMAPEQLEGKEADTRTDIFAFGLVLYEMITGKKTFEGKTQVSLIAAILEQDPPAMSSLIPATRPALDRIVKKCLAKDPEERWHCAHDLCDEMKWVAETPPGLSVSTTPSSRRVAAAGSLITLLLFGVLGVISVFNERSSELDAPTVRFSIPVSSNLPVTPMAFSPDGEHLAYVDAANTGTRSLWIRSLNSDTARQLQQVADIIGSPFWSPDGEHIAFISGRKLRRISSTGGLVQTLADVPPGVGVAGTPGGGTGAWGVGGTILVGGQTGIYAFPDVGGSARKITTINNERQERAHISPTFLPDGKHFLYFAQSASAENRSIYAGSIENTALNKSIFGLASPISYVHPGYLLFQTDDTLFAQRFLADRQELQGEPIAVSDNLAIAAIGARPFTASSNGKALAFRTGRDSGITHLLWASGAGSDQVNVGEPGLFANPVPSPDGSRVAVDRAETNLSNRRDIWLIQTATGAASRFTFHLQDDSDPLWSPDGKKIIFSSNRLGQPDLYIKDAGGAEDERLLLQSSGPKYATSWSSDGGHVLYQERGDGNQNIWVLSLVGDRKAEPLVATEFTEQHAQFSPDKKWFAYASDASGRSEIYVRPFRGSSGQWQVTTQGGSQPMWRPDGKALFYLAADQKMMAVPIKATSTIEAGIPQVLFQARPGRPTRNSYAVSADGRRFLLNSRIADNDSASLTIILNWAAGLKND